MYVTQQALASLGGVIALVGGVIGSALGIGIAAPAGVAALADDPKQMRNVVVLAAMPFTQTFYGLVTLIIIFTSAVPKVPAEGMTGLMVLGIGFITGHGRAVLGDLAGHHLRLGHRAAAEDQGADLHEHLPARPLRRAARDRWASCGRSWRCPC